MRFEVVEPLQHDPARLDCRILRPERRQTLRQGIGVDELVNPQRSPEPRSKVRLKPDTTYHSPFEAEAGHYAGPAARNPA